MSEVDELSLDDIIKFLWSIREYILKVLIVLILLVGGTFVLNHFRSLEAESGDFSSANLDRVERGIYRLRVEIFGNRLDPRREDAIVDFDRELNVTIQKEDEVLSLRLENLKEDIVVHNIRVQGRLRNRDDEDDFYLVDTTHHRLSLSYNQVSRGVPLVAYTTDIHHNREINNWILLRDISEFRENFELEFVEISFYFAEDKDDVDENSEPLILRYVARSDLYELFEPHDTGLKDKEIEDKHEEESDYDDYEQEDEDSDYEDSESESEEQEDEDSELEDEDSELEDEDEDEEQDNDTHIEFISHIYDTTQTFAVTTSLEEIVVRIEHSDENWIDSPFYGSFDDVLEETLVVDANGVAEIFVGAVHTIEAMFINGVEVDFETNVVGFQQFVFNVTFE